MRSGTAQSGLRAPGPHSDPARAQIVCGKHDGELALITQILSWEPEAGLHYVRRLLTSTSITSTPTRSVLITNAIEHTRTRAFHSALGRSTMQIINDVRLRTRSLKLQGILFRNLRIRIIPSIFCWIFCRTETTIGRNFHHS